MSAQPVALFIENHRVSALGGGDGRAQPGSSAANHCDLLGNGGGGHHAVHVVVVAVAGVHRTDGQLMVVAELRGAMALVAQDAGGDVLALSGVQLLHVVVVGKEGPGGAEHVALAAV